eukprot:1143360-Karenia_brevis.AAC.1
MPLPPRFVYMASCPEKHYILRPWPNPHANEERAFFDAEWAAAIRTYPHLLPFAFSKRNH